MKKKPLIFVLIIGIVLNLSACGNSKNEVTSSIDNQTVTIAPTESTEPSESIEESESLSTTGNSSSSSSELTDEEYAKMLQEYSNLFLEQLEILSEKDISNAMQSGNTEQLPELLNDTLLRLSGAEETLQNYYNEFDKNRTQPPMGTKIMTLLSHAQSALRQYTISLEHLQDYLSNPNQSYLDDMSKYANKAADSLNDYNDVLTEELERLGIK